MSDLVERLTKARLYLNTAYPEQFGVSEACAQAADEIERLRSIVNNYRLGKHWKGSEIDGIIAENERLRAVLERIASIANYTAPEDIDARLHNETQAYAIAREALENKG